MARENPGCGYVRIVGAISNLGHSVCDEMVGNILRQHGIPPAPKRSQTTTWKGFIAAHMAVLTGIDFFVILHALVSNALSEHLDMHQWLHAFTKNKVEEAVPGDFEDLARRILASTQVNTEI